MKKIIITLIFNVFYLTTFAQNAAEIDPKFIKIPRYTDQTAITTSISSPTSGMLVYNNATASIWFHNGISWANTSSGTLSGSGTTNFIPVFTSAGSIGNSSIFLTSNAIQLNKRLEVIDRFAISTTAGEVLFATIRADGMFALEVNGATGNNALVIDDDGDESVMIGTNVPVVGYKLNVNGKTKTNGILVGSIETIEDGGNNELMFNGGLRPKVNNVFSLGTSTHRWTTVYATNGTINTSDATLKTDINNAYYGLKEIMKMRPVSYHWKNEHPNENAKIGFLAQDLKEIIPEVVVDKEWVYSNEDRSTGHWQPTPNLGVKYSDLIPITVSAIQEQQKLIETLKAEIEVLKQAVNALKK